MPPTTAWVAAGHHVRRLGDATAQRFERLWRQKRVEQLWEQQEGAGSGSEVCALACLPLPDSLQSRPSCRFANPGMGPLGQASGSHPPGGT